MAMKGQFDKMKFDEFSLVILGGIIFLGILLLSFGTPGEFPPKVTPSAVTLNLDPGSFETFDINISGKISEVNITTSGEIATWIQPSRADLGVLREKTTVLVTVSVPSAASAGTRKGKIIVSGKEGRDEVEVTVVISSFKRLASRVFGIGDFRVSYLSGSRTLDTRGDTFVSKSYLYEKPLNLVGIVNPEELPILTSGFASFVVEDTNNYGPIILTQNGRQIFSEVVGPGEVIVPLNLTDVRKSNTITIRADNPGIFFWAENVYSIRNVSLDIGYRGSAPKTFNFTLLPEEARKFDHAQITYNVRGVSPGLPPMRISLNGQTVFFERPPATFFSNSFARDISGGPIKVGEKNSLVFSFDQEASYDLSDANIIVFTRAS